MSPFVLQVPRPPARPWLAPCLIHLVVLSSGLVAYAAVDLFMLGRGDEKFGDAWANFQLAGTLALLEALAMGAGSSSVFLYWAKSGWSTRTLRFRAVVAAIMGTIAVASGAPEPLRRAAESTLVHLAQVAPAVRTFGSAVVSLALTGVVVALVAGILVRAVRRTEE